MLLTSNVANVQDPEITVTGNGHVYVSFDQGSTKSGQPSGVGQKADAANRSRGPSPQNLLARTARTVFHIALVDTTRRTISQCCTNSAAVRSCRICRNRPAALARTTAQEGLDNSIPTDFSMVLKQAASFID